MRAFLAKLWAQRRARWYKKLIGREALLQKNLLQQLISFARNTAFGRDHHLSEVRTYEEFRQAVPIYSYETLWERYLSRAWAGEPNVTWVGRPKYFAKTSGTTAGAKFLPLTRESIPTHIRGARDTLLLYVARKGKADFVNGRWLFLSGSPALEKNPAGILYGRLSGIVHHWVPRYLTRNRLPSWEINCIEEWQTKVRRVITEAAQLDLRLLSGIPPWIEQMLLTAEETLGKKAKQIWPHLQVYIHGGVDFRLYEERLRQLLPEVDFIETFPASEGFFAFQDTDDREEGLRLLVDNGIFYEFIPLERADEPDAPRLPLWEVEVGRPYALLITTNAGLWGYAIGDVVRFTQLRPYRLQVVGRVKNHLSAFGEHVIEAEVERALQAALKATGARIREYTVGPYLGPEQPRHEWLLEIEQEPDSWAKFQQVLDETLQQLNPYYADLRRGDILARPRLYRLPPGAGYAYMESQGRLGGQNKFPHLRSDRVLLDALLPQAEEIPLSETFSLQ
ncbi:MAG: GH3 auxin-responsive promoter family protein [Bacteroidia bacterium]|nr:GH3 auxin-responsive promoter family protein [Bacteroidia bacterium]MDW8057484.1 GH3 auxin-responsive promoter family protein [Bacteroidia bacterium]